MNFYTRRIQQSIWILSKPNLKNHLSLQAEMLLQRFFMRHKTALRTSLAYRRFVSNSEIIQAIHNHLKTIPMSLKNESHSLLRVWVHQCECVIAQRIRRSQQMFALYAKIWEEQALRRFLTNVRQHLAKRGKEVVFSAVGVSAYNWDSNRISEDEMRKHLTEIEYIQLLKRKTIDCSSCNAADKSKIDKTILAFCECDTRKDIRTYEQWSVFIEQKDLIVWRRPHKSGSFEYKVYGNYNDVTAEDFLSVQIDTKYRKQWDPTVVELQVVERDILPGTNSDVVYWEMQWPRLFANRDYVFKRRFLVDRAKKLAMLLSKGTEHSKRPAASNKFRVADYWSSMVIKPYVDIDKPGIEFSLTYFDNPGVNIPASVTAWVAYRAMPDFLTRLRAATTKYKQYCIDHKCRSIYTFSDPDTEGSGVKKTSTADEAYHEEADERDDRTSLLGLDENFFSMLNNELDEEGVDIEQLRNIVNGARREHEAAAHPVALARDVGLDVTATSTTLTGSSAPGAEVILTPSQIAQADQSYWKYLQPTYYIS